MVSAAITFSASATEPPKLISGLDHITPSKGELLTTDNRASFIVSNELSGVYIVSLTEKSALDKSYAYLGNNRRSAIAKIDAQQKDMIAVIKSLDSAAIVLQKVRLVDNSLHVQLTHEAAALLASNSMVTSIYQTDQAANNTEENSYKPYPYLAMKDVGDSITVAVIGNGVDYTHAALGGKGTEEEYAQA